MYETTFKPIIDHDSYSEGVQAELDFYLWGLIFRPVFEILKGQDQRLNATIRESRLLLDLLPCEHNRTINRSKVDAIKKDVVLTGAIRPFVVVEVLTNDGVKMMITDGHHRYVALKELIDEKHFHPSLHVPTVTSGENGIASADHDPKIRLNASAQLKKAFATGRLQYRDGYVYGNFNAAISKSLRAAGAKWIASKKGFKIDIKDMSTDLKIAVGAGMEKATRTLKAVQKRLDEIERARENVDTFNLKFEEKLAPVFKDLDIQFVKTTSKDLEVRPEMNPGQRKQLTEEYTKDLNRYIKDYAKEAIVRLRERVEEHALEGFRAESLQKILVNQYGIEKRRAKFLARQETSLLVSAYRKARYEEVGLTRYKWSTSHDSRVREDHKLLNGKIFNWSEPPITDRATGARNHPGQDFGCRCVAIPVMRNR